MIRNKTDQEIMDIINTDRIQTTTLVAQEILQRVKSPLAIIRGRTENLKAQLEYLNKEKAQGILDQVEQLEKLLKSVEELVTPAQGKEREMKVADIINDLHSFFNLRMSQSKIQLLNIIPRDFMVTANESDFRTVLSSVIINAIEALEDFPIENKNIFVQYQTTSTFHILSVEDNGPGFTKDALQTLYQPFSTTKKGHIGLSLAICRKIVEKSGWALEVVSREGQGTRIEIWIPKDPVK